VGRWAPTTPRLQPGEDLGLRGGRARGARRPGQAKTAANYAHSLQGQKKAASLGYSQVLWLDAIEHRYVEEVGTMNIFFHLKDS
jgi:branched-subunit amino acid aminotransferase/4-amino-4-deoxychorismate lyase